MSSDLLDLAATPERLRALADAGVLTPPDLERALRLAVATPERPAWRRFLSTVLLGFGSLLVLSGVIYFFAYNWAALHRFGKMGLLLAAIIAASVAAWRLGEGLAGQFALLFAAVLVGPLLAVYGQAYQTGADPYELFLGWSLLVLPWVVLARFEPLWLLLLLLVDTGLCLFWVQVADGEGTTLLLVLSLVNGGAWLAHELLAQRDIPWLHGRWLPRVLAVMTLAPLVSLATYMVAAPREADTASRVALGLLLAVMAAVYFFHRQVRSELFLLTLDAVSAMTLITTFIGRVLFRSSHDEVGIFLVMALLIIGEVGLAVWWLRAESRGQEEV
ncbi:DUF2157 domain-containing protein [Vitiosangium sp. GDMCC 1.1324]|uniref:DUF2157 domain-containing protein n=1 Tax=Vitiosangium sp. (strain GDMCC 1.1324) TaxID=2138576 RepID=UPI000D3CE4FA|nr:DUF2157 domain-containing protein [Vitiosangium sp. GDMCC 1.1324]PTL78432.1 DUF2157 domain-containing protein [Vitiosangium sp. GDMCC 1.1324]